MEIFRIFGSVFLQSTEAEQSLDQLDRQGEQVNSKFTTMAQTVGKFGLAAAVAVGTAAVAMGVKGVMAADDLQKALNGLQAQTGTTDEKMVGMKQSMLDIYNNNFGASFEDIGNAMATIAQQTGLTGTQLTALTQNALALRDTFQFEVNESMRAAEMMFDQFGLSGEEAFNLIAQGAQNGLNKNDDLLDSINEYSVHFAQMGIGAEEMFNMLVNGAANGTFSVDKLGDAVKEFGIRAKDGSKGTNEAFTALGLNAQQIGADFAAGGEKGRIAFTTVTDKLLTMKDPLKQNTVGTALFGTTWEDLGAKGIKALTNVNGKISLTNDALKKINEVKYNTFGEAIAGIGRQLETGILIPIGEKILPKLNDFANWFNKQMPAIKQTVSTSMDKIEKIFIDTADAVKKLSNAFIEHKGIIIPLFAGIAAGATTFGLYTLAINAATIATKIWTVATAAATVAGGAFTAVLAFITSPIGIVVLAIGALVAAGVALYMNWDKVKAFAGKLWASIQDIFGKIRDFVVNSFNMIANKVSGFVDDVKNIGRNIVQGLWKGISDMGAWIKDKVIGFVAGIGSTIKDFFGIASPSKLTTEYGKSIAEGLVKGMMEKADAVAEAAMKLSQAATSKLDTLGNATITALKNKYEKEETTQIQSIDDQIYQAKVQAKTEALIQADSADKKLQIQQELNNMLAQRERELITEKRYLKVTENRVEMQELLQAAAEKKDLLQAEYDNKKLVGQAQLQDYLNQLETEKVITKTHYEDLTKAETLQAEARKLALDDNNKELITLLETYNPKWQDAGQSFGESLLNGLNSTKQSITNTVNEILGMVNQTENAQNKVIIQAKELWTAASKIGDTATMSKAHSIAEAARAAGGTIGANEKIPKLAKGGNILDNGSVLVGESGPEILSNIKGAKVTPLAKQGITININNPHLFNDRDADKLGDILVNRLRGLAVST